eukprot:TRINITY_DN14519_c0_g1_i1.p3 TRINITY_DN14519_c0_g1~~TRINITY_DN14519_c0_g1_i1.p3  ORF type:complete len:187 (-),score=-13.16 TRINITY_DN14519_c0_g1_i1:784-1344(-)
MLKALKFYLQDIYYISLTQNKQISLVINFYIFAIKTASINFANIAKYEQDTSFYNLNIVIIELSSFQILKFFSLTKQITLVFKTSKVYSNKSDYRMYIITPNKKQELKPITFCFLLFFVLLLNLYDLYFFNFVTLYKIQYKYCTIIFILQYKKCITNRTNIYLQDIFVQIYIIYYTESAAQIYIKQ